MLSTPVKTIAFFFCVFTAAAHAQTAVTGMPIASVNGTPILEKNLELKLDQVVQQLTHRGYTITPEQREILKGQVFERLIDEELLFQKSLELGLKVAPSEIAEQIDAFRQRFRDDESFHRAMEDMNLSEQEMMEIIERSLGVRKLVEREITPTVTVRDAEIERFYEENPSIFREPERVKASHILIRVAEDADEATRKAAMRRITAIQEKIESGEDFAELARKFSEGPTRAMGGDLGFFTRREMVGPFSDAAFSLEPGQTSGVVTSPFGYHLIKVFEKKPESTVPLESAKAGIVEHLKTRKLNEAIAAYVTALRGEAEIDREL